MVEKFNKLIWCQGRKHTAHHESKQGKPYLGLYSSCLQFLFRRLMLSLHSYSLFVGQQTPPLMNMKMLHRPLPKNLGS